MEEKIKQVIKEYVERVLNNLKTLRGCTSDYQIDCPKCGGHRSIVWNKSYWACGWFDCKFHFPENLTPPSPRELEEIYEAKQKEKRRREITNFLKELGINLE
jgi:hypothetical protein